MADRPQTLRAKWYDDGNRGELHDDLRSDYDTVVAIINSRPSLKRHFAECGICAAIRTDRNEATVAPAKKFSSEATVEGLLRSRKKFVITAEQIRDMLGLAKDYGIAFMQVTGQQDVLEVTVVAPSFPVVPYGTEPDIIRPKAVQ